MGTITPNPNDMERARLINYAARRCALAGAARLLKKAIARRDSKTIKTASAMIQHALYVQPDPHEGFVKIDVKSGRDAFYSSKKGESLRPVECNLGDCESCFWLNWCATKENLDILKEADATIKRAKRLLQPKMWGG